MTVEGEQMQKEGNALYIAQFFKAIQIFEQTPWCAKLLHDPSLVMHQPVARAVEVYHNNYDSFMSRTLATEDTIRAYLTIRPSLYTSQSYPRVRECITLFDLGENLSGHQRIAHGGVIATLLDEGLGQLISLNDDVEKRENSQHVQRTLMTLYLNITYRKTVPVPAIILCRTHFDKIEGRKHFVKGALEDSSGTILAQAEGLFLEVKEKTDARQGVKL